MSATDQARKLLADATVKADSDAGHYMSEEEYHRRSQAVREIEELGFAPATLAVAITLAEALEVQHNANPNLAGMEGSIRQAHHDRCRGCKALGEWEKLMTREEGT